jgi:hypothetical protein
MADEEPAVPTKLVQAIFKHVWQDKTRTNNDACQLSAEFLRILIVGKAGVSIFIFIFFDFMFFFLLLFQRQFTEPQRLHVLREAK